MKILADKHVKNFNEATEVAFREAGADDMGMCTADLFEPCVDRTRLRAEAEKNITAAIRARYKDNPTWSGKWWHVPVPSLGYDSRGTPHITFEVNTYLVAQAQVDTGSRRFLVTLVGTIDKGETLVIPVIFLQAMLDDDLDRFAVVARSGGRTTWEIPGVKALQLPDDFIARLSDTLQRRSVAAWLEDFGSQGRRVMPLVVGSLLGLQFMGASGAPSPAGKQPYDPVELLSALEALAYSPTEAKEMVGRAAPHLRADHTLEEALRVVLQNLARGG